MIIKNDDSHDNKDDDYVGNKSLKSAYCQCSACNSLVIGGQSSVEDKKNW